MGPLGPLLGGAREGSLHWLKAMPEEDNTEKYFAKRRRVGEFGVKAWIYVAVSILYLAHNCY